MHRAEEAPQSRIGQKGRPGDVKKQSERRERGRNKEGSAGGRQRQETEVYPRFVYFLVVVGELSGRTNRGRCWRGYEERR